jgi:hypothetical protein
VFDFSGSRSQQRSSSAVYVGRQHGANLLKVRQRFQKIQLIRRLTERIHRLKKDRTTNHWQESVPFGHDTILGYLYLSSNCPYTLALREKNVFRA